MSYIVRNVILNPQLKGVQVSEQDKCHFIALRNFVSEFIERNAIKYGKLALNSNIQYTLLDIAPQDYIGAQPFFKYSNGNITVETLDINPNSNATYIADITQLNNKIIPDNTFDYIIITEVLEHTLQPFNATIELYRMLKPNGILFVSVPCNFRIHGPLPDSWRFTHFGLQYGLFTEDKWEWLECDALESSERALFPIDYSCVIRKRA
jgi:SAM-dependent methyltransferase